MSTDLLVPAGTKLPADPADLWQDLELKSKRDDAVLGLELLLLLPKQDEFPIQASLALARHFVRSVIVDRHRLAATLAIHAPHGGAPGTDMPPAEDQFAAVLRHSQVNLHAHILVSPRQYGPNGFDRRRYTKLEPVVRGKQVYGRAWGELWQMYQNQRFFDLGIPLRVTPNAPIPLTPVPLKDVRRWRRRALRRDPRLDGRGLLVNQAREAANRALVATIDDAMGAFRSVFTRQELQAFFSRHAGAELAAELTSATIAIGACVAIDRHANGQDWYATPDVVHQELAVFGRALLLGQRTGDRQDVTSLVSNGFPPATAARLSDIFNAPDLVIVEVDADKSGLAKDLCLAAEFCGLVPVSIPGPAGHPLPRSVIIDASRLRAKPVWKSLVLVDDPDAFHLSELSQVLGAVMLAGSRLVLLRRRDSDWARSELLDLVGRHVVVLDRAAATLIEADAEASDGGTRFGLAPPRPPTSAISGTGDWPQFAVDEDGAVVTRLHAIARLIRLLALDASESDWADVNPRMAEDAALLDDELDRWTSGMDSEADAGRPGDGQLAVEAAALEAAEGADTLEEGFDNFNESDTEFQESWDEDWDEMAEIERESDLDR